MPIISTRLPFKRLCSLLITFLLATTLCAFTEPRAESAEPTTALTPRPKLILVLVIDQFRADYLTRFESSFLPPSLGKGQIGGFRYLMQKGAYFPYGQYDILQSMTGPGHSTILTGAYPYLNGIVTNYWFDQKTQQVTYCSEDTRFPEVGGPTEPHTGTSPALMISTTVGDELKNAGFSSKVVTVALKDRAAILLGGHRADLALWFNSKTHQWVSSEYYLPNKKLPEWIQKLNAQVKKSEGKPIQWMKPEEIHKKKSGMIWDETIGDKGLSKQLKTGSYFSFAMPYGTELTEQAAEAAFTANKMEMGERTNLFAVSFSSHDYAAHAFGPNSRQMEVMTRSEDRLISKFLNFVKKRIPLDQVTIVLTADHGAPPNPDWLSAHGIDAGRIDDEKDLGPRIDSALNEKFGKPSDKSGGWLAFVHDFNFYLNQKALDDRKVTLSDAEAVAKAAIVTEPGAAFVFTSTEYKARKLPPGMHERQILHTYFPGRSGNVILIPKPFYMKKAGTDAVDHMTGYSYDRTVPVIFAGFGVRPGVYATRAEVVDIAPTLTFLSGVVAPSLSEGRVLSEILRTSK
jgi:predicted AlkP superfamily pyrophosphatase or phosphodiesterase